MTGGQGADPVVTADELLGRIAELEIQRDAALNRCVKLRGENNLFTKILVDARSEIQRLSDQLEKIGSGQ